MTRAADTLVLKVFFATQERISERIVEQIVDSRVFGVGLQDFRPGQSSSASSSSSAGVHGFADELDEGFFFRTFPRRKKRCGDRSALGVGTECGLYSVHAGCLYL